MRTRAASRESLKVSSSSDRNHGHQLKRGEERSSRRSDRPVWWQLGQRGALILWVGQTTFRHAGLLAGVDERFESTGHQFNAVDSRHEMLRQRVEQATSETAERTRSRFTREDAEKLAGRINEIQEIHAILERQFTQRLTNLQIKVTALETHGSNYQELAMLRSEVQRLRTQVAGQQSTGYAHAAAARPTYLPPVTQRR